MSIHDGHRQRIKEEFLSRSDTFPDYRVLEVLLYFANPRGDTNPLAHRLMEHFGTISSLMDADPAELKKVSGVGDQTVVLLKVAKELGGRYLGSRFEKVDIVYTMRDMFALFYPHFFGSRNEKIYLACLDGKNKCIGVRFIHEGIVNSAELVYRKVVEAALALNAVSVILAHNHPTGTSTPSDVDCKTTNELMVLLQYMSITLRDHLVFGDSGVTSIIEGETLEFSK